MRGDAREKQQEKESKVGRVVLCVSLALRLCFFNASRFTLQLVRHPHVLRHYSCNLVNATSAHPPARPTSLAHACVVAPSPSLSRSFSSSRYTKRQVSRSTQKQKKPTERGNTDERGRVTMKTRKQERETRSSLGLSSRLAALTHTFRFRLYGTTPRLRFLIHSRKKEKC